MAPEYTLIEFYETGVDHVDTRTLTRDLLRAAARAVDASSTPASDSALAQALREEIPAPTPWPARTVHDAVSTAVGVPVSPDTDARDLRAIARRFDVPVGPATSGDETVLALYDHLVEPTTHTPTLTDFHASQSPVARPCAHDPRLAQKWGLVIGGVEVATSYTELADGAALRARLAPVPRTPPRTDRTSTNRCATRPPRWRRRGCGSSTRECPRPGECASGWNGCSWSSPARRTSAT